MLVYVLYVFDDMLLERLCMIIIFFDINKIC